MKIKGHHISCPPEIWKALKAYAKLRGQSVSDIVVEQSRALLREVGYEPPITAADIAAEIERANGENQLKSKRNRAAK